MGIDNRPTDDDIKKEAILAEGWSEFYGTDDDEGEYHRGVWSALRWVLGESSPPMEDE